MKDMSIEEILKRAEEIKAEAERQLEEAERNLNIKVSAPKEKVRVDDNVVKQSVSERIKEEEDVKEYVPKSSKNIIEKTQTVKLSFHKPKNDDDIKIADNVSDKTIQVDLDNNRYSVSDKTQPVKQFGKESVLNERTRPVIFSTNTEKDERSDLESIPTIVSKEHIYDGYDVEFPDEVVGIQMSFEGFEDTMDTVHKIDEDVAEQMLEQRRQEKVGKFRLFGPDETDKELGGDTAIDDEYENEEQNTAFLKTLNSKKALAQRRLIATAVLGIPMLLMATFKDSQFFPTFLTDHTVYFVVSLVLFVAVLIADFNVIVRGLNLKKGFSFDFSVTVFCIAVLVHTIACMVNESLWIDNGVLMTPIAAFALFMSQLGKRKMLVRIMDNFEFITLSEEKYTVENIANNVDANIIGRGIVDENPIIKTSVKTDFATNFLEISCKSEPADKIGTIIGMVGLLAGVILMLVVGFLDSFDSGINSGICAFGVSLPLGALFLTNDLLTDISAGLDKYGSRVCGFEGAMMAEDANAMVMSGADLFGKRSCDLLGIKTFNGAKVDDAIIQAAAVMIQTGSPLAHVFDDVIIGKQSILPRVEGVTYEDKMGTSAWIYKRKVLVGNRDLLIHHGVNVPKESFEKKYTVKGRKALYLAVNGRIIAMFVVSYSADPDLKRELKKLEKSGITLIIKSCDPYINEEALSKLFDLPMGFIRVMNHSSARVFDKYSNLQVEKSPAYVVHDGTAKGFVSAMHGAEVAVSSKNMIAFLLAFGGALGVGMIAFLSCVNGFSQITTISLLAFQIIWNLFVSILAKLKRLGL